MWPWKRHTNREDTREVEIDGYDEKIEYSPEPLNAIERASLFEFFAAMERELCANGYKGGWHTMPHAVAWAELVKHFTKLRIAYTNNEISLIDEYAADVANCCMMLRDVTVSAEAEKAQELF